MVLVMRHIDYSTVACTGFAAFFSFYGFSRLDLYEPVYKLLSVSSYYFTYTNLVGGFMVLIFNCELFHILTKLNQLHCSNVDPKQLWIFMVILHVHEL